MKQPGGPAAKTPGVTMTEYGPMSAHGFLVERTAAELTGPMMETLMNGFYNEGSASIIRPKGNPTRKALVRRGLVHDGDNRWTALGREVAQRLPEPWNIAAIKGMDELHEMALTENDTRTVAARLDRISGLCLRATGAHVGHMKAVTAECREEETGPSSDMDWTAGQEERAAGLPSAQAADYSDEPSADKLVHYWPAADGRSTDKQYGDLSACGIDIAKTSYTYGSPKWDEVTCGQCLTMQPPVDIAKGGHLAARYDITPAGRDYLMATEVIEGSRVVGGMTGAGKTTDPVEAFYRALGQRWH
jgi:hypothetical protein